MAALTEWRNDAVKHKANKARLLRMLQCEEKMLRRSKAECWVQERAAKGPVDRFSSRTAGSAELPGGNAQVASCHGRLR
jgi:hypothetical protein